MIPHSQAPYNPIQIPHSTTPPQKYPTLVFERCSLPICFLKMFSSIGQPHMHEVPFLIAEKKKHYARK